MLDKIFPKIHSEGYKFIVISILVTLFLLLFSKFLGILAIFITIWIYYFFRDPEKVAIDNDEYLVSPADGLITDISEVDGPKDLNLQNQKFVIAKNFNHSALKSGVILSITNPQNIAYWAALGSSFSALGISDPELSHYFIFFSGFISSSILWCLICAFAVEKIFRYANSYLKKYIFRFCSVAFLYLALGTFYNILY